ncbi:MAG: hypothetical protein HY704_00025 [Gemmatimonadetes bacterium]|nr:hypothetical protein [Gemmatimonadota bacterium]
MAVTVVVKKTGETVAGKYATIGNGKVNLSSGIMADKKGGFRGCGRKQVFDAADVTVKADDPAKEIKRV